MSQTTSASDLPPPLPQHVLDALASAHVPTPPAPAPVMPKLELPGLKLGQTAPVQEARLNAVGATVMDKMITRRENICSVVEAANDQLADAVQALGDIMRDNKASTAQLRAAESIIAWAAGAPERFSYVALNIKGMSVNEAMDTILNAAFAAEISIESAQTYMTMLKVKSDATEVAMLTAAIESLQAQMAELKAAQMAGKGAQVINNIPSKPTPKPIESKQSNDPKIIDATDTSETTDTVATGEQIPMQMVQDESVVVVVPPMPVPIPKPAAGRWG